MSWQGEDEIIDDQPSDEAETSPLTPPLENQIVPLPATPSPSRSAHVISRSQESPSHMIRESPSLQIKETVTFADSEILYRFPEDANPPPSQVNSTLIPPNYYRYVASASQMVRD